jgi:hypothetical protein
MRFNQEKPKDKTENPQWHYESLSNKREFNLDNTWVISLNFQACGEILLSWG